MLPAPEPDARRVLVLAPVGRDGPLACAVVRAAGIEAAHCADGEDLVRQASTGVGALVLSEEVVASGDMDALTAWIARQPPWSDVPVVVLADSAPASLAGRELLDRVVPLGNVTILERPVNRATLVSAVESALRARERQYQVRGLLAEQAQSLELRDQFLAMLGHELRNPLGAICNTLHAIDLGNTDNEGELRIRSRERALIGRQVGHLTRLVDDLLDVSRVTSGKIALKSEQLDLVEVVFRSVETMEEAARVHGVTLELAATADSLVVEGDSIRLEQVMTNLLTNAIKYTPPQGKVSARAWAEADEAVVSIADTGAGLSPGMLERVFDLFNQSYRTLERAEGGLGIGLTLVRALVRLHGGDVSARSPGPGKGSTFEVRLPLAVPVATSAPPRAAAPGRASKNEAPMRVLVVEDSPDNRESLIVLLEHLGHHAAGAEDGPSALRRLAAGDIDLAFVDIGLPEMDGYEVARRARQAFGMGPYLVALTGYGQPDDRLHARNAGFDDHVTKPIELAALDGLLARAGLLRSRA